MRAGDPVMRVRAAERHLAGERPVLRPLVVDLLVAMGMPLAQAQAGLRER